ncbi:MAG: hypothetical protein KGI60_01810 [Patescibacteria group bacterium]|nr:hypothetical protein [Patescibacteria group bacterium]
MNRPPEEKVAIGIFGGGYGVLEAFWRIAALKKLNVTPSFVQAVSSGTVLAATFIQAYFDTLETQRKIVNIIKNGPKVFKEVNELVDMLTPSLLETITKLETEGASYRQFAKLIAQLGRLGPIFKIFHRPSILQGHVALHELITSDLELNMKELVRSEIPLQVITKNESHCCFTSWLSHDSEMQQRPFLLEEAMIGSMAIVPLFEPYHFATLKETHSDGLTLRLGEFIRRGHRTIILFATSPFEEYPKTPQDIAKQNLFQRTIDDFHTDVNLHLIEELKYAAQKGYRIITNKKDPILDHIQQPAIEQGRIVLSMPTHWPEGLNLVRFPTTSEFEKEFISCGLKSQSESEKFLDAALHAE